jgi:hypothetical protein
MWEKDTSVGARLDPDTFTFLKSWQGTIDIEGVTHQDKVEEVYLLVTHKPDWACNTTAMTMASDPEDPSDLHSVTITCEYNAPGHIPTEHLFEIQH